MKYLILLALPFFFLKANSQELYTFTEPASNMAAKTIGVRLNNYVMKERIATGTNYHLVPEVMVGLSRKIMLHADAFISNRNKSLSAEGGSFYAKYRFYSADEVQQHFRMAAFGRYSFNNSDIHQEEINLYGHNSGYEAGIVATQLLHKVALSSGLSLLQATNNGTLNKFPYGENNSRAVYFTLSAGKLFLPKQYISYKQLNVNGMVEILNQYNPGLKKYYIDVAPSVQFIFNSVARLDIGYRQQISSTFLRTAPNGVFLRLEYNFFNMF